MGTEAGLALVIDPGAALAALKRFDHGIESSSRTVSDFARRVKSDFDMIGRAAGVVLLPLKALTAGFVTMKASVLAAGAAALKTAADFEMFRQQLLTVTHTKEAADRAFQESLTLAAKSPFSAKEIIETRIALEGVGVRGPAAVKAVAEAAAALGRNILDVSRAVKSMETEPLRNLNIDTKKEGEQYIIGFQNRMEEAVQVVAKSRREAQQAVLDAFTDQFAGGMARMSYTFKGFVSNFGDVMDALKNTFGEGFLDEAKLIVSDMIEGVESLRGGAKEAGIALGDQLAKARIDLLAGFYTALDIAKQIGQVMQQDGGVGTVILEALKLGASVLGEGIIAAFEASISLWKVIGATIGEGVLQAIYQSNIPGSGMAREWAIGRNLKTLGMADLHRIAGEVGVSTIKRGGTELVTGGPEGSIMVNPYARQKTANELIGDLANAIEKLPMERQLQYAQLDAVGQKNVSDAVAKAYETIGTKSASVFETMGTQFQVFLNKMAGKLGVDPIDLKATFSGHRAEVEAATAEKEAAIQAGLSPQTGGSIPGRQIGGDGASAFSSSNADAVKQVVALEKELQREMEIIGRLDSSHERAAKMVEYETAIRAAYSDSIEEQNRKLDEYRRLLDDLEKQQKLVTLGNQVGDAWGQAFEDMVLGAKTASEAFKALGLDIARAVLRQTVTEKLSTGISNLFVSMFTPRGGVQVNPSHPAGYNTMHGGGIVGSDFGPMRFVDPSVFGFAPRLHSGLDPDEFPAILQRGERVLSKAQVAEGRTVSLPTPVFNVTDSTSGKVDVQSSGVQFDGRRMLVGMVLKDRRNNGPMSRAGRKR